MRQLSAGLLMYRTIHGTHQFFLVHPGGPFYAKKDDGVWTIPKGLIDEGEELLGAAKREFLEETGIAAEGNFISLSSVRLKSGKEVHAWMFEGEWDESGGITSNTFPLEWPPRSGKFIQVPEADRGGWFDLARALEKINLSQQPLLLRAAEILKKA
jgi:predicted NUDIX family NTP pyrophosphohydrolase